MLNKGDEAKHAKNFKEAEQCYLSSAQLVETHAKHDKNFAIMCAHSFETLADLYTNFMQDQGKGLFYYKKSVEYCNMEGTHSNMPRFKAKIMCMCYFGLATALSLLPQRDYQAMLSNLDTAFKLSAHCHDNDEMKRRVIYMYIAVFSSTRQQDQVQYWYKVLQTVQPAAKEEENQSKQQQGMVFVQRLMEIEQGISHATAKEQVKKAAQLYEDTLQINPEFAASVAGQVIYYHRLYASLKLEDGVEWGKKALAILQPKFGEKHGVIRNVYLSLSDVYSRLGNSQLALEYKRKMEHSQRELGM